MQVSNMLESAETVINHASLQKFAKITPQYPGLRAPLDSQTCAMWAAQLSPHLNDAFGYERADWAMQAWFSIVTARPDELIPMQCFPHVDGTDPDQLAMMLYLDTTEHGGTAFFRHRSTGYEELTEANFPHYRDALQADVAETGLPPARYVTDGAPHFERTYMTGGEFNQAVFYRGNILHSGMIENDLELPADPRTGRLTINAFFRRL
ncbi:hypothetical protein KCG46_12285 [Erythrobacter sp. WH158]|uniref:Uncharacterized protein n=2 Tax=Erythrobacter crassostreae TaxID=2828328 RepID=A0A9X1JLN6_9SPHN|nr:hypothetical protein [Erythrobacter crassostrea]